MNLKYLISLYLVLGLHFYSFAQPLMEISDKEIYKLIEKSDSCKAAKGNQCVRYIQQAIALGKEKNVDYVDYLYFLLADYYETIGNLDSVVKIVDVQLKYTKHKIVEAGMLNKKAAYFYSNGNADSSVYYFLKVAAILENENELQKSALTYYNLSAILYTQHSPERSLEYILKAYNILSLIEDTVYAQMVAADIAVGYVELKRNQEAINWSYRVINQKIRNDFDQKAHGVAFRTLAIVFKNTQLDSAFRYINNAIMITEKMQDWVEMVNNYQILSEILLLQDRKHEALVAIEKAISIAKKINFVQGLTENLFVAGKVSKQLGYFEKAADYLLEYKILNDSIKSDRSIHIINELTTKYDTEKKERQIAESELIIEQKSVQIRNWLIVGIIIISTLIAYFFFIKHRQKTRVKILMKEKENEVLQARIEGEEIERGRISKELHDGVASSLLVTRLKLEHAQPNEKPQILSMLIDIQKEVRNISHKLIPIDFETKNWVQEVEQYCQMIDSKERIVHFYSNTDGFVNNPTHSLILFRAVQEILQNALKHAAAKNISVQITKEVQMLSITVEDDGNGVEQKVIDNARSLTNLKKRLIDINVNLDIESNLNEGTFVHIVQQLKD